MQKRRKTIPVSYTHLDVYKRQEQGNPHQWGDEGYPKAELLSEDIRQNRSYVCVENGDIVGTFCYFIGTEPSYREIREGGWLSDRPYGVLHRLASDGRVRGVASATVDWCLAQCGKDVYKRQGYRRFPGD